MISVIVCTYNPKKEFIRSVLNSLRRQTLSLENWELIIIDNGSTNRELQNCDLSWHSNSRIVVEKNQGLAHARIRGVIEAKFDQIVFVDDDNMADDNYLLFSLKIFNNQPDIGVFGGKAIPHFVDNIPENWIYDYLGLIGCRDLGDQMIKSNYKNEEFLRYPEYAPIGTGMAIRKKVFLTYLSEIQNNEFRLKLGRNGSELTSGEDNDIVISSIKSGWNVGYFPELIITHIIPNKRTEISYLAKMVYSQQKSWIKLLLYHNLCPWKPISPWTVPFRKLKAWLKNKAWQNKENYLRWKGACGMFDGLAERNNERKE